MSDTLVKVENVSKKFCRSLKRSLWYGVRDIGAELLGRSRNQSQNGRQNGLPPLRTDEFWALQDINFELKRGECLGLIGKNGAGKSTLLKMLNGLLKPDTGRIEMRGRIGALIELGTGFNPILTGRENVYVNGSVLGFTKKEIDRKLDAIIDFAEIGDFIDMPVKNYSSGMRVRLGFAVAAQMEPDVLLIDEVLAVGDIGFVLKCFNRMDRLLENTAIIFVSHNIPQVARICTNLVLMNRGQVIYNSSNVSDGINLYYSMFQDEIGTFIGSDKAKLRDVYLSSGNNTVRNDEENLLAVNYGDELRICLAVEVQEELENPQIGITFFDRTQRVFAAIYSHNSNFQLKKGVGVIEVEIEIPAIAFAQGVYSITVILKDSLHGQNIFRYQSAAYFQVKSNIHGWAPLLLQANWSQSPG